jgi:hypothetical protein
MLLKDIAEHSAFTSLTPQLPVDSTAEVHKAYASDLLSDVIGNAPAGGVLITVQVHANVIAVASLATQQAIIFALGRKPDEETCTKAAEEGIHLFTSTQPAFEIAGQLYEAGVRGLDA